MFFFQNKEGVIRRLSVSFDYVPSLTCDVMCDVQQPAWA